LKAHEKFVCENGCEVEEFSVFVGEDLDPDGIGILVTADGRVTNRWSDGTAGISQEQRDFAAEETEGKCTECGGLAVWTIIPPDEDDDAGSD
jgi:hypothetical protein